MRTELEKLEGQHVEFTGKVTTYGTKRSYKGKVKNTILLKEVKFKSNKQEATDHVWLTVGVSLSKMSLYPGEEIEFTAIVRKYSKGYIKNGNMENQTLDYKLIYPTKIKRI